ncbi:uncharacterized protein LOC113154136 [Anabas testudineus]|uniref:uncharacterized protein LOC113154136 n=1 Tax=Anabas testudineus TaxID=64144 RepID=UPI000E454C7D|nr:uncharacterized protein LOC113154136 [Anabas testudineus]
MFSQFSTMSTQASDHQAEPHVTLNVRHKRRVQMGSRERDDSEEADMESKDHHIDIVLPKSGSQTQKTVPGVRSSRFRASTVMRVLYLLILAGIIIRYISVTVQKDQLTTIYEELKNRYDNLSDIYNQTTFEEKQLKEKCQMNITDLHTCSNTPGKNCSQMEEEANKLKEAIAGKSCPDGWMRFGCNCYYKFTERKSLKDSGDECQRRGGTLMVIDSTEKQTSFKHEVGEEAEIQLCD